MPKGASRRLMDQSEVVGTVPDPAAGRDIGTTWDRMMVTAPAVDLPKYEASSCGLGRALNVLEIGYSTGGVRQGGRAVPSAGGIYPYECCVLTIEDDGLAAFRVDLDRRTCSRVSVPDPAAETDLTTAGFAPLAPGAALVAVVNRPWLSMRKYGDRGYLYTLLDAAHLATNLLGCCAGCGFDGELRLRFLRTPLSELLDLHGRCREVSAVLRIGPGATPAVPGNWAIRDARVRGAFRRTGDISWLLERACWETVAPLTAEESPKTPEAPETREFRGSGAASPVRREPLVDLRRDLPLRAATACETSWNALSSVRASTKRFSPGPPPPEAILWRVLSACRMALNTDVPIERSLRLTLVTRSPSGTSADVVPLTRGAAAQERAVDPDDVVRACMNQEHLRHAAAFVLFHVPRQRLLAGRPAHLKESLFRAGAIGHLLYLGAAEEGMGITAIGGFDAERWRLLAGLPAGDEVIYVIALGTSDAAGVKWDRAEVAYAHGRP